MGMSQMEVDSWGGPVWQCPSCGAKTNSGLSSCNSCGRISCGDCNRGGCPSCGGGSFTPITDHRHKIK